MKTLVLLALLVVAISCQKETYELKETTNPELYGTWISGDSLSYISLTFTEEGQFTEYVKSEYYNIDLELKFRYTSEGNLITLYLSDTVYVQNHYRIVADSITFYSEGILEENWYKKVN